MSFRKITWATSHLMVGLAFTLLFAMKRAQADDNHCPTPSPEQLKTLVLSEKRVKLGAESRRFSSAYSLERTTDDSLEVYFFEEGAVLDADAFVVVVDPCQVKILRSFIRPSVVTGIAAPKP